MSTSPASSASSCAGASISPRTLISTWGSSSRNARTRRGSRSRWPTPHIRSSAGPRRRARFVRACSSGVVDCVEDLRPPAAGMPAPRASVRPFGSRLVKQRDARVPARTGESAGTAAAARCASARRPCRSGVPRRPRGSTGGDAVPLIEDLQTLNSGDLSISEYRSLVLRSRHDRRRDLQSAPHSGRAHGWCAVRTDRRRAWPPPPCARSSSGPASVRATSTTSILGNGYAKRRSARDRPDRGPRCGVGHRRPRTSDRSTLRFRLAGGAVRRGSGRHRCRQRRRRRRSRSRCPMSSITRSAFAPAYAKAASHCMDRLDRARETAGGASHPIAGGMIETAENLRREYGISPRGAGRTVRAVPSPRDRRP